MTSKFGGFWTLQGLSGGSYRKTSLLTGTRHDPAPNLKQVAPTYVVSYGGCWILGAKGLCRLGRALRIARLGRLFTNSFEHISSYHLLRPAAASEIPIITGYIVVFIISGLYRDNREEHGNY